MIERVIENWLTSANERQYQLPFCQLLAAEGETIIYVSSHGQLELGIDVLSVDSSGTPKAYQLKRGDISLSDWRRYQDEVVQLVESHPRNPALSPNAPPHKSFFVTNGTIKDPVLNAINHRNTAWKIRNYGPLTPISKTELLSRFKQAHGRYFPESPTDLKAFLELYTAKGVEPLCKTQFAEFIETLLPLDNSKTSDMEIRRATASAVLITSYLTQNNVASQNHWAIFEAWVITGSAILSLATKSKAAPVFWQYSFELCEEQALAALTSLCRECSENDTSFTQGSPLSDGYTYSARMSILCGLIAAHRLSHVLSKKKDDFRDFAGAFLYTHWRQAKAWGESAIPFFVLTALALEADGKQPLAEGLIRNLIETICTLNGSKGRGFPNPYWEPEKCLRLHFGLKPNHLEDFVGHSYTLQSLVHLLARRWRRDTLRSIWYAITEVNFATLVIHEPSEWLRWESRNGLLDTRPAARPQSWEKLLDEAENAQDCTIPNELQKRPEFLLLLLIVYPHRFHPDSVRLVDKQLQGNLS